MPEKRITVFRFFHRKRIYRQINIYMKINKPVKRGKKVYSVYQLCKL